MAQVFRTLQRYAAIRSVRFACTALLGLGVLASFGWQVMDLFRTVQHNEPVAAVTAGPATAEPVKAELGKTLLQLFGASAAEAVPSGEKAGPLPESNLNIQVSAIFFQSTPEQSSVVLEDGDNTLMLKSGDEVRQGITVRMIEGYRITLERSGKLEQISFRGFGGEEGASPDLNSLPPLAQTAPDVSAIPPVSPGQGAPAAYQQYIQRKLAQNK